MLSLQVAAQGQMKFRLPGAAPGQFVSEAGTTANN